MPAKIRKLQFGGLRAVELRTSALRLVAVTSRGPRLAFFGPPGGDNLLYWAPGRHRRGKWDLMGGHRLWTARPGADECEETYRPDNAPCVVERTPGGFTVVAPVDPETKIQRGIRVRVPAADRVELDHFARNTSDMLWSGGLWALTCTVPGAQTTYSIPLGDGSAWDYAAVIAFHTWGGGHGGAGYEDAQFSFTRDQFVLRPAGRENKRMLKADAGILAMHDPARGVLFAKQAPYCPAAHYPLGTNLAVYVGPDNFMVELESMGPFVTLKPGATVHHVETWVLRPAGARPPGATALKKLFA
jgi:hypothetical protein